MVGLSRLIVTLVKMMTVMTKVWDKLGDVPAHLRVHDGAKLTLAQVNHWARIYDAIKRNNPNISDSSAAAMAWAQWAKIYVKRGNKWIKRREPSQKEIDVMAAKFEFGVPITEFAKSDEDGKLRIVGVASSTAKDKQNEKMSRNALQKMTQFSGIDLLPGHHADILSELGTVEKLWLDEDEKLYIEATLDEEEPKAKKLFRNLQAGKRYQLSVGGRILSAKWATDGIETTRVIDDVELDHIAITREGMAANPDTFIQVGKDMGWLDAMAKSVDWDSVPREYDVDDLDEEMHELVTAAIDDDIVADDDTDDDVEKVATEAEKKAQQRRSKRYNIAIRPDGNVTKPSKWKDIPDSKFADPVNYAYPMDTYKHAVAALRYWGKAKNRAKYSKEDQKRITARMKRLARAVGVKTVIEEASNSKKSLLGLILEYAVGKENEISDTIVLEDSPEIEIEIVTDDTADDGADKTADESIDKTAEESADESNQEEADEMSKDEIVALVNETVETAVEKKVKDAIDPVLKGFDELKTKIDEIVKTDDDATDDATTEAPDEAPADESVDEGVTNDGDDSTDDAEDDEAVSKTAEAIEDLKKVVLESVKELNSRVENIELRTTGRSSVPDTEATEKEKPRSRDDDLRTLGSAFIGILDPRPKR